MSDSLLKRVQTLGLTLPAPSVPIANFVPFVVSQNLLLSRAKSPYKTGSLPTSVAWAMPSTKLKEPKLLNWQHSACSLN
jgi:hypothetical protein